MSISIDADQDAGTVRVQSEEGIVIYVSLRTIFDAMDDEALDVATEHIADRLMDKVVERLCGDALFYEWPTDQRRAHKVLLAMEERVLGTRLWGAFDETERAIRECILQDDRRGAELPYEIRSKLIDIAHGRARHLRRLVSLKMRALAEEVHGGEEVPS